MYAFINHLYDDEAVEIITDKKLFFINHLYDDEDGKHRKYTY